MALWQKVEDGKVVDTSASATSSSKEKTNNNLDKDDFLNLLVAQMKYQDPLEPQSNTEYVSQLATFTQVEATENMAHTAESLEAGGLIGKTVIMRPTNSVTGETSDVVGVVDYMMKEGSNIYLAINGSLYNLDELYTVADSEYMDEKKKFHLNDAKPLVYSHGEYLGIGKKLGTFGYSVKKKKKFSGKKR